MLPTSAFALLALAAVAAGSGSSANRPPRVPSVWHRTGMLVHGTPPVLVTTFRPASGPPTVAYVAWVDHTLTNVALYPGRDEPPGAGLRGPAEIPNGQRWRLVATFNGGFKSSSGSNGFAVNGHTYHWLRRGLGTLVGYRDGRVDVVRWRGGPSPPSAVVFARQNLPLLVDHGRPAPNVANGHAWGATLGGVPDVWRTGVGVDRRGNLVYAAAGNETAAGLAGVLVRAGAVRAIELDINPEWPTFNFYTHDHGLRPTMFVPNPQQSATRYLFPDSRDFFAVYRQVGGAATVPFR
jgi:Phosphodiester glycosidase